MKGRMVGAGRRALLIAAVFVLSISIVPTGFVSQVAAQAGVVGSCTAPSWLPAYQGWYRGYFTNAGFTCSQLFSVLDDGVPSWVTTKEQFRDFIYNMHISSSGRQNGLADRQYVATSYIIQTMRGAADHGFPDAGDLNDWLARINNPNITVSLGNYSAYYNSARYNVMPRDAGGYIGDGQGYHSMMFHYQGNIVYVVKYACANPLGALGGLPDPLDYNLEPAISGSPNNADSGSQVNVTPSVFNHGSIASTGINWRLDQYQISPAGVTSPVSRIDGGNRGFPARVWTGVGGGSRTIPDVPVGTRICYRLSVQPRAFNDASERQSGAFCVTVSKKPKVQVIGGDLMVGRGSATNPGRTSNVVTSTSNTAAGGYYGSWSEYAILPSGTVRGMSSGSGYVGGAPSGVLCSLSILTFSNAGAGTCNADNIGRYIHTTTAPNIAGRFPISSSTARISGGNVNLTGDALSGLYTTSNAALSITGGGDIPAGRWVVINAPNTDVTITGDIRYTGDALSSVNSIPQVVIIARNIIVSHAVQNIDSWLVAVGTGAHGRINTCGAGEVNETTALTAQVCDNKLTVNGPVSANHLIMRRTAGAGTGDASGDPAEVFNLRADAYIWASSYSPGTGRLPTVKTTELPPRF